MNIKSILTYTTLFVYGLSIPQISYLTIIIYGLIQFTFNSKKIIKFFWFQVVLLIFFVLSYFGIASLYEFIKPEQIIHNLFLYLMIYIIGATINLSQHKISYILLSMIMGVIIFSFGCTYIAYFYGDLEMALFERTVVNMWNGSIINSPIIGANSLLALSLIPLLFLPTITFKMKGFILILIFLSSLMPLLFQSRGPIASAIIIFIISYIYIKLIFHFTLLKIKYVLLLSIVIFVAIYYLNDNSIFYQITMAYSDRLDQIGTESDRYRTWIIGIESFFIYPFGGKEFNLGNASYLHNMFLDMHHTSGILPLLLLFIFIGAHYKNFSIFLNSYLIEDKLFLFIFALASLLPTFFEPIMEASPMFFTFFIFFLALLRNYSKFYTRKGFQCQQK